MTPPKNDPNMNQPKPTEIRLAQQNIAHSRAAMEYLLSRNPDIAIISEPPLNFRDIPRKYGYKCFGHDEKPRAIILSRDSIRISPIEVRRDAVACQLYTGQRITSLYSEDDGTNVPNLDLIRDSAKHPCIIGGDVNAYAVRWHSIKNMTNRLYPQWT